jgi:hypothetical protein
VKSIIVCERTKSLILLLKTSSIHIVDIEGNNYLSVARYDYDTEENGNTLQSLHPVTDVESNEVNFMAVSNKGDRLYFKNDMAAKTVELKHTIAPPSTLPGALFFNNFTEQSCDKSFYDHGVFVTALSKSERKHLVLSIATLVKDPTDLSKSVCAT